MRGLAIVALVATLCACDAETVNAPQLQQFLGRPLVINYWAKWCKPCIEEIPELNALAEERTDITVLGVNYDGAQGEELAAQVNALGIEFSVLLEDPAAALGSPRPVVLPATLIVDREGRVKQTLLGPQTLETLQKALEILDTEL